MIVYQHRGWLGAAEACRQPFADTDGALSVGRGSGIVLRLMVMRMGLAVTNRTLCAVAGSLPVCELVLRQIKDGMPVVRHQIRGNQRNLLIGVVVEDPAGEIIQLTPSFAGD